MAVPELLPVVDTPPIIQLATVKPLPRPNTIKGIDIYKGCVKAFKFNISIEKYDKKGSYIYYSDEINFLEVHSIYQNSDLSIFASSCETFGQIVLESMASGLPIACSNMSSMKEIIKDGCVYFNPLDSEDIKKAIKLLLDSPAYREEVSTRAYDYAKNFSWQETSRLTFEFLEEIHEELT